MADHSEIDAMHDLADYYACQGFVAAAKARDVEDRCLGSGGALEYQALRRFQLSDALRQWAARLQVDALCDGGGE